MWSQNKVAKTKSLTPVTPETIYAQKNAPQTFSVPDKQTCQNGLRRYRRQSFFVCNFVLAPHTGLRSYRRQIFSFCYFVLAPHTETDRPIEDGKSPMQKWPLVLRCMLYVCLLLTFKDPLQSACKVQLSLPPYCSQSDLWTDIDEGLPDDGLPDLA